MNIEVIRYRLPVYWACALINDDYTGLCKEECQEIKNFLNIADGYPVDVDWEKELRSVLGENVNKSISRNMKIKATKYRNDYRVWLDYAGDYRNENIE